MANINNLNRNVSNTSTGTQAEVNLQQIRDKAENFRQDLLNNIETQLQDSLEDFVTEVEKIQTDTQLTHHVKKVKIKGELPSKEFISRRSILTELLETSHIKTIYHIFLAVLIVFSINTILFDIINDSSFGVEFDLILWGFGSFPTVITTWILMQIYALILYPPFQLWAFSRTNKTPCSIDYLCLGAYILYQIIYHAGPIYVVLNYSLPPISTIIIIAEQIRFVMKTHSFVRENAERAFNYLNRDDVSRPSSVCPDFSNYLYFLFCPTLIYRDEYPRTQIIRWDFVVTNFLQVFASLVYIYYIFVRFMVPVFRDFNPEMLTSNVLLKAIFNCMLPGFLVLLIGFYAILHCWLNAFAEMLKFADRLFYRDWWNSSSFASYYRTWNIVVHDWLYTYIYKDICKVFGIANKPFAMACVFFISAIFHEYVISLAFGFCYPVLLFMFAGVGFSLIFLPSKHQTSGNIFLWVMLISGQGMLLCLYSLEWYARRKCPVIQGQFLDLFIPRSWFCDLSRKT